MDVVVLEFENVTHCWLSEKPVNHNAEGSSTKVCDFYRLTEEQLTPNF